MFPALSTDVRMALVTGGISLIFLIAGWPHMARSDRTVIRRDSLDEQRAQLARRLAGWSTTAPLADRLIDLRTRLDAGRFHLAVLGQFKRGKSTLLNALLGESFLPTGVVPLTAIPTLIEYGPECTVRVLFQDGRTECVSVDALDAYVTETGNPENARGVATVEVEHPAPLLARGVVE